MSTIGDCYKLAKLQCREQKAVVVIGYEHLPSKIDLTPLIESFELIAKHENMPAIVSYPRRLKSGHITCYLNRTYHVLTTLGHYEA